MNIDWSSVVLGAIAFTSLTWALSLRDRIAEEARKAGKWEAIADEREHWRREAEQAKDDVASLRCSLDVWKAHAKNMEDQLKAAVREQGPEKDRPNDEEMTVRKAAREIMELYAHEVAKDPAPLPTPGRYAGVAIDLGIRNFKYMRMEQLVRFLAEKAEAAEQKQAG